MFTILATPCYLTSAFVLQTGGNIVALAVDADSGYLFWANNARRSIYRANTDGSEIEAIVSEGKARFLITVHFTKRNVRKNYECHNRNSGATPRISGATPRMIFCLG